MDNKQLIEKFYTSFANGSAEGMISCYHDDIQFEDPAFGKLEGEDVKVMWQMLLSRNSGLKLNFNTVEANKNKGSANWVAEYTYSQTGRKVVNKISAKFEFADGKIIKHTDYFDIWKWTQQALGWKGYLLGWTPFMQNKIRKKQTLY
ncbi:nuclear transport factor 2 family protein [Flavobacterium sp.]|uniref:nuclear transport factor 2 family protein n=1 Tax=Flavobacterium sp. TaxID=239 RepID=UPI00374D0047